MFSKILNGFRIFLIIILSFYSVGFLMLYFTFNEYYMIIFFLAFLTYVLVLTNYPWKFVFNQFKFEIKIRHRIYIFIVLQFIFSVLLLVEFY